MVERSVDWEYPVAAAVLTAVIFVALFQAGIFLNDYKVEDLRNQIDSVETEHRSNLIGLELSQNLQKEDCRALDEWMNMTVDDLRNLRMEVAAYENSNKIDNDDYTEVKKRYMNLLLQNLIQVRNYDSSCEKQIVDIIYFYEDDCDACTDQATVLTNIRQEYGQEVVVYPLDTELDMQPINFLQNFYEIERYPSIVVAGEPKEGFQSIEKVREQIENTKNTTESSLEASLTDVQ